MLTIIYRGCSKELEMPPQRQGRPYWFSKINCFNSIHNSLQNSNHKHDMKLIVLIQGDKSPLTDFINDCGYDILYHKGASDIESKTNQVNFSDGVKDSDIYFVEDDYLHCDNALDSIYTGVRKFGLVTGYDCSDRYTRDDDVCKGQESIYFYEGVHWRTAESTTNTWAVSKEMRDTIIPYTKHYGIGDRIMFRHMYVNGIRLHQPMLGVCTHVHEGVMGVGIDWEKINNQNAVVEETK